MVAFSNLLGAAVVVLGAPSLVHGLKWGSTKNLFVFGDSYTATGYNVSAGINSPTPGWTSSNGWNWVQYLGQTYNVTPVSTYNLGYGGATIDSKLVTPYLPTVQSFVTQIGLWQSNFASHPAEAPWTSQDSLFAIWIGINDVGNSWYWTNVTQSAFHKTLMDRLFGQVDLLYTSGARSFLFLTTPPLERAPLFSQQGPQTVTQVKSALADYNAQLKSRVANFTQYYNQSAVIKKNGGGIPLGQVTLFDTGKVFNALLDNSEVLGFTNVTGWAEPYANGTPTKTTQVAGYKPVSSYFWLNSLHPLWTVHDFLAKAISTVIS